MIDEIMEEMRLKIKLVLVAVTGIIILGKLAGVLASIPAGESVADIVNLETAGIPLIWAFLGVIDMIVVIAFLVPRLLGHSENRQSDL